MPKPKIIGIMQGDFHLRMRAVSYLRGEALCVLRYIRPKLPENEALNFPYGEIEVVIRRNSLR